MNVRKPNTEDILLALLMLAALILLLWLITGCSVLTQRNAKVTYTKGCAITLEGMEVQKAAETARHINMDDCTVTTNTEAEAE